VRQASDDPARRGGERAREDRVGRVPQRAAAHRPRDVRRRRRLRRRLAGARRFARQAHALRRGEGGRPERQRRAERAALQVAVVTGASSGIGAAIARALAARRFRCVLLARREERLRALAEELDGEYEVCDVSERDAVDRAAAAVLERHPRIALLVNNAGIPGRRGFLEIEPDRLEALVRTNYLGGVWCLRAFLPGLEAAGRADVVNVVSVAGTVAFPPSGPYSASKHAQLAFSRATAAELRPRGIRVHTVNPGFVETEGFPQRNVLSSPLGRAVIEPQDVAAHVLRAIERDRAESFIPAWYRVFAIAQALAPGLIGRAAARSRYRRQRV
jgi:short-subunit dehydrogenase